MTLVTFHYVLQLSQTGAVSVLAQENTTQVFRLETIGPDGNLWVSRIDDFVSVSKTGQMTSYPAPSNNVTSMTAGPDGAIWFTQGNVTGAQLGRISTSGVVTYFQNNGSPWPLDCITAGPDGNLWAVGRGTPGSTLYVYRIATDGTAITFSVPGGEDGINIVAGPDGALWFLYYENSPNLYLGRITTSGAITTFSTPDSYGYGDLVSGPRGKLWMVESARLQNPYQLISFDPTTNTFGPLIPILRENTEYPSSMAYGIDGNLWLAGRDNGDFGRVGIYLAQSITASPSAITLSMVGQTAALEISEADYTGDWNVKSTNAGIATISRTGFGTYAVTAISVGTAVIVVKDTMFNSINVKVTVQ